MLAGSTSLEDRKEWWRHSVTDIAARISAQSLVPTSAALCGPLRPFAVFCGPEDGQRVQQSLKCQRCYGRKFAADMVVLSLEVSWVHRQEVQGTRKRVLWRSVRLRCRAGTGADQLTGARDLRRLGRRPETEVSRSLVDKLFYCPRRQLTSNIKE